jgi:RimJ/RimL family protein N-acetyltransferase
MPGPVFIEGEHVSLRTVEEEDVGFLQAQVNDARIWRPIDRSWPLNREQERGFFDEVVCDDDTVHLLVATDAESGPEPVGMVGLDPVDHEARRADLGYWVAPDHQRQGYGTAAVRLLVGYGFDQLGLHKLAARVFEFNDPSARLLERVGFVREGVHRDEVFVDGAFHDTYWYGLLAEEWRANETSSEE